MSRGSTDLPARSRLREASASIIGGKGPEPSRRGSSSHEGDAGGVLDGKRILIVEDEFLLAVLIEETLQSFGCETIGPFTKLELGLKASRQESFDLAILDINLNGTMAYPLADELLSRGIPFLFLTGYAAKDLPEAYRSLNRLQKPFDPNVIRKTLEQLFARLN